MNLLIIILVSEGFGVAGLTKRLDRKDRVAIVPHKYITRRAHGVPVHAVKVVGIPAFTLGDEMHGSFLAANPTRHIAAYIKCAHY